MSETLRIFVRDRDDHREIAVYRGARLIEYYREERGDGSRVGAICLGRVQRVLPEMKTAFVEIDQRLNAYLPLREQMSFERVNAQGKPLRGDDEIIVQIKRDAHADKGASLTRDITLPGQYVVLMPMNDYLGVSKRVSDEGERAALLEIGRGLQKAGFGLIMRYAALFARRDAMEEELQELLETWNALREKAPFLKPPAVLWQEPSALNALARDYAPRYQLSIIANNAVNRMPIPNAGGVLWEQQDDLALEATLRGLRLEEQLSEALSRVVHLQGGGTLVIDEREALSTIDVNTGSDVGAREGDDFALRQNLTACPEIARQLRLRNLSGVILIDFINMPDDAMRDRVAQALESELAQDRVRCALHGFTKLGLMEMTRKRTRESLQELLTEPCGACRGSGRRRARGESEGQR